MMAWLMGLKTVSPSELRTLLGERRAFAFDVNARGNFQQAHVPGAAHLDPETFQAQDLPADRGSLLVFYCSNPLCRKAPNAALRARAFGYTDARVMAAGIKGWMSAGMRVEAAAAER
jgi:rhodanese-related sulfurtransferase